MYCWAMRLVMVEMLGLKAADVLLEELVEPESTG